MHPCSISNKRHNAGEEHIPWHVEAPVGLQGPGRCGDAQDNQSHSSCPGRKQSPRKSLHWSVCYLFPSVFNWISVMRPKKSRLSSEANTWHFRIFLSFSVITVLDSAAFSLYQAYSCLGSLKGKLQPLTLGTQSKSG